MPTNATDATFQNDVLNATLPVLVDFWAPWCGPCKIMIPILEELASELEGKLTIVKVNVDENQQVPSQYNVMSLPTFMVFKGGQPVHSFIGSRTKDDVKRELEKFLA